MKPLTFSLLLFFLFSCTTKKESPNVLLLPLGKVNQQHILLAQKSLAENYGCTVYIADPINIPDTFRSTKYNWRYRADYIIKHLRDTYPDSLDNIVALTEYDISTFKKEEYEETKDEKYKDWGIFGLGYRPGRACIISTFRLKSKSELLSQRVRKVVLHEFGHNLGLDHCADKHCVMTSAAEKISNLDATSDSLCVVCKKATSR